MLRKSILALFAILASALVAQTVVFTPTSTIFNPAGGNMTFTATITYSAQPSVLAFSASLPANWIYLSTDAGGPDVRPAANTQGTLGWAYAVTAVPASPATFTFQVQYPAPAAGVPQMFTSNVISRDATASNPTQVSGPQLTLAVPSNTATWNNNAVGNWTASANWSGGIVPNNGTPASSTWAASVSSGTATVSSPIVVSDLLFYGGTINGLSSLSIAGSGSDWQAGVFSSLSQLTIGSGAFFNATGNASHDFGGTALTNNGQFIWTGAGDLRSGNGGSFLNASGATFTDTSAAGPARITNTGIGGSFTFSNQGTYVKTGITETKVEVPFTNSGTILVNAGNLRFASTFTQSSGNILLSSGATAQFDTGLNLTAGSFTGSGTISGNVVNGNASGAVATISPGAILGQLAIQGNLTLLNTSQLLFDIGGTSSGVNYDFLNVSGTAALGGTLTVNLVNNFSSTIVPGVGGTTFTLLNASSLSGVFSNAANNSRLVVSGGIGSFLVNYTTTSVSLSNFQFTPVPEPSTWAMLTVGLGTMGVAAWRRRRRL